MTSSLPKITIVTPSFNQGQYLEDTIRSVLDQAYPNLEYIIIDGGSTDSSVSIIKKYEEHLAYWVSEQDQGLYHGLQKGFDRASGDIMAWINADDMYHRKSLFTVAQIFEKFGQVHWLMGSNTYFDQLGHPFVYDDIRYSQRWSSARLHIFDGSFIQQESVFWRRALWEEAGSFIDQQYTLAADFELWNRFFRYEKLYTTSFLLAGFRLRNQDQKSYNQRSKYLEQLRAVLERGGKEHFRDHPLWMYRLLLTFAGIIPKKKWRSRVNAKILDLPPRIIFDREHGFLIANE